MIPARRPVTWWIGVALLLPLLALIASAASFVRDDTVRCMRAGINGRATPSTTAAVTVRPNEGDTGVVLEGPRRQRGTDWWRIDWGGRRVGWTAEHAPGQPGVRYLDLVAFVRTPAAGGATQAPPPQPAAGWTPAAVAAPGTGAPAPVGVAVPAADRTEMQNLRSDLGAVIQILGTLDARIDSRLEAREAVRSKPVGSVGLWVGGAVTVVLLAGLGLYLRHAPPPSGTLALLESRVAALERRLASQAGPAVRQTTLPPAGSVPRVATATESTPSPSSPPAPTPAPMASGSKSTSPPPGPSPTPAPQPLPASSGVPAPKPTSTPSPLPPPPSSLGRAARPGT